MARDASGNYTLPVGNPVVSGTVIESVWANTTLGDLSFAMTESLSRQGEGAMLAPLGIVNGTQGAPSLYFGAQVQNGLFSDSSDNFNAVIANVPKMRWSALGSQIWDGTQWDLIRGESDHHFDGVNPTLADAGAAITIGGNDPDTEQHVEIGPTAIQAKLDATSVTSLSINTFGGDVLIGDNLNSGEPSLQLFNGDTLLIGGDNIVIGESPATPQISIDASGIEIGIVTGNIFIGDSATANEPSIQLIPAGNSISIGAEIINIQEDSSSSGINIDSGSVVISNSVGDDVLQTTTAAAGGVLVNNLDTGSGLERVLTESDITNTSVRTYWFEATSWLGLDPDPVLAVIPLTAGVGYELQFCVNGEMDGGLAPGATLSIQFIFPASEYLFNASSLEFPTYGADLYEHNISGTTVTFFMTQDTNSNGWLNGNGVIRSPAGGNLNILAQSTNVNSNDIDRGYIKVTEIG